MQSKLEAKYLREIGEKVYSFFFENPEMENNNLEFREGQSEMACEIVDAISQKKNLVVEAGVGIGKSFAYLVPLIYYRLVTSVRIEFNRFFDYFLKFFIFRLKFL